MATPFPPGEPSEHKPGTSSSLTEQDGAPHDFGGASGENADDEIMQDANPYDTPSADAENTGGHLVLPGGGLPTKPLPLLITAGPSYPDELPYVLGRPPKRPRVDALEEHDNQLGGITVELPKSHQGKKIIANRALTQQLETLKNLHKKTEDEHKRTLCDYRNEMKTFTDAIQRRMDQAEAAAQAESQRAANLQAIIRDKEDAQARMVAAAAERENLMIEMMQDLKKSNAETQEQLRKDRDEAAAEIGRLRLLTQVRQAAHQDVAGSTSSTGADYAMLPPENDVATEAIREYVQEQENTAKVEKQRADELQAALNARTEEVEVTRRREAKAREQAAALKTANDDLLLKQAEAEKKAAEECERLRAEKDREVSSARMQKQREANARGPRNTGTGSAAAASAEDHDMGSPPETSGAGTQKQSEVPKPLQTAPAPPHPGLGPSILRNMRTKKALAQQSRMTRLRPKTPPNTANEDKDECADGEEGDDEDDGDDEDVSDGEEHDEGPSSGQKSKGKEKSSNRENFGDARFLESLLHRVVKNALVEYGLPTPSASPEKRTYTKSQAKQEVGLEAKTLSKDAKNAISLKIRRVIKDAFKLEELEEWVMHVPATEEDIDAFVRHDVGSGPDPDALRVDMWGRISSTWNAAVVQILLALVLVKLEEDASWLPKVSDSFLRTRITERLSAGRTAWKAVQPKLRENGDKETPQQVEDRVVKEKTLKEAANCAGTRRCTKYNSRWNAVHYMVVKKSSEPGGSKEDLALWKWLLRMLENLGKEGMSSDESVVEEGGAPVYRVKRMPWRRADVDKNLLLIDKQRFSGNGMISKRGNKPATRITTGDAGDSRRPAPPGRFRAMYNEAWVGRQHPVELKNLRISEENFVWVEYYTIG